MSEKSLFRVLLKILSLALALYGGYGLIVTLIGITCLNTTLKQFGGISIKAPSIGAQGMLAMLTGPAMCLAVGLYIFLAGDWLVEAALPLRRGPGDDVESLWQRLGREAAAPTHYIICPGCGAKVTSDNTICPTCRKPLQKHGPNDPQP